jgi:hypothetical protein
MSQLDIRLPTYATEFESPEDRWEELLLRNPRFQERVEQARHSVAEGEGITLEGLRSKHNIAAQDTGETQPE